jgi:tripartite-type tricarboxylate transporter receptor subunit TctC
MTTYRRFSNGARQVLAAAVLASAAAALPVSAQTWPDKPLHIVVPFAPGGVIDLVGRAVGAAIAKRLNVTVIIDNKPGAGGMIGSDFVAKSKPDGTEWLISGNGFVTQSAIISKMPFSDDDLVPVALLATSPSVIVAPKEAPYNNLKELMAWARTQPGGALPFATAGVGSTPHFVLEMLKIGSSTTITPVAFKSGSESVSAVMGNHVPVTSEASPVTLPQVRGGSVKALAITSEKRSAAAPDIPTAIEEGFPAVRIGHWEGLFAPRGTPDAIIEKMNAEMQAVTASKEFRELFASGGTEPLSGDLPAVQAFIKSEKERLGTIARNAKMQAD